MRERTELTPAQAKRQARQKAYYQAHRDEIRQQQRKYYQSVDKAVHAAKVREYRRKNHDQTMLEDIQKIGNIHWLNQYEENLRQWSAEKTRECYVEILKQEMQRATNRKEYWTVIQWLKKLRNYPEGEKMTEAVVQYWCEQHSNRSAMKDELRKARYI